MRRDSRRFVHGLDLPPADSIRELLPAIEERSGYSIRLAPAPVDIEQGLCGLWIRTTEGIDYIFVDKKTSRAHQDHIIAHEIAHILCSHHERLGLPQAKPIAERLVTTLDPEVVRMMLGRSDYEYRDEREAELIGSYLQRHVHRPNRRLGEHGRVAQTLLRGKR